MPQVLIVSNRLPVNVKKIDGKLSISPSVGGLATGLSSYVSGKRNQWIGWPGIASDELTEAEQQEVVDRLAEYNCSPVFLSKREINLFYNGYSNALLWPLFHNLPYKDTDRALHTRWWRAYRSVNNKFAEAVLNRAQPDSRIWVHDYQLLLVPQFIRKELNFQSTIGFFLHIPFPGADVFRNLAEHKKLLQGMAGADLIGMHTSNYVDDFLENCQRNDVGVPGTHQLVMQNRVVRVAEFPMGIDYDKYAAAAKQKAVKAAAARYRKRYKGLRVIAAVDRLDPSKGLVERLKAYQSLLEQNSQLRQKVVFSMIAAPSRTDIPAYKNLAKRMRKLVDEVNATYGTAKWQPVDYIDTAQPFEEVSALFQIADVAFIVPLKDGMNLAAKEFVASNRGDGVLVLSTTAGAAEELQDALLVNPRRPQTVVNGLKQALTMPKRELRGRLRRMQKQLSDNTVHTWAKTFVQTLQQPVPGSEFRTFAVTRQRKTTLIHDYKKAGKRLLLLDYDGSLVPFSKEFDNAKPPRAVLSLLDTLSHDKDTDVVIVSGRSSGDLQDWFGHLPIGLVAEHGACTRPIGKKRWHHIEQGETAWKKAVEPMLSHYTDLTPSARLEEKGHSLVWHYRSSPPYYAQKYAVTIKQNLRPLLKKHGLQVFQGNKILEIKDPRISKGNAIKQWLNGNYDFTLILGDDFTDEDMFKAAPADAYTLKVGRGRTQARWRIMQSDIVPLLKSFTAS